MERREYNKMKDGACKREKTHSMAGTQNSGELELKQYHAKTQFLAKPKESTSYQCYASRRQPRNELGEKMRKTQCTKRGQATGITKQYRNDARRYSARYTPLHGLAVDGRVASVQ